MERLVQYLLVKFFHKETERKVKNLPNEFFKRQDQRNSLLSYIPSTSIPTENTFIVNGSCDRSVLYYQ